MSSPVPFKRRKLNDAAEKLRKPFVSPMRSRKPDQPPTNSPLVNNVNKTVGAVTTYTPSTLAHTIQSSHPVLLKEPAPPSSVKRTTFTTPQRRTILPQTSRSKNADPEERTIQKANSALELQIRRIQNELDILKQAETLSNSTTDADLEELREKWRLASQYAAEELFGTVKERVCRMGGVAAWREMEKKKHDRSHGLGDFAEPEAVDDDADCEFDSQGEELPEDEQEYRKKLKRKARQEAMEAMDEPDEPRQPTSVENEVWQEPGKDDDTFTMDMMLRSLNIDLSVIGYDKQLQKWI
ncbi:hypothetical protein CBER1_05427 [Cercospora berteroae]|uniref:DNA repair protein Dds20/Mei5 n=1 Tax=Cercospora berteroae TaxID=357750 RepID=A0A2S6C614_9PEZI|nr:hypothetical protein CBER1_05427 [Cercospora berteroae]